MRQRSFSIMAVRDWRRVAAAALLCLLTTRTHRRTCAVVGLVVLLAAPTGCADVNSSRPAASVTAVSTVPASRTGTPVTREAPKVTAFIAEPCASLPAAQQEAIATSTGRTLSDSERSTCTWRFGVEQRAELEVSWSHGAAGNIDVLAEQDPRPEWDAGSPAERTIGTLRALFPNAHGVSRSPNCNVHVQLTTDIAVSVAVEQFHASDSCLMVDTLTAAILTYVNPAR